jgi:hypothetical protein
MQPPYIILICPWKRQFIHRTEPAVNIPRIEGKKPINEWLEAYRPRSLEI